MIARTVRDPASALPRSLGTSQYIFAAVVVLRLIALSRLTASPLAFPTGGDMRFYAEWASRISHGQLTDHLAFFGLPLYAYLLAGLSVIFGASPYVPAVLQIICDAGTATLLYKISSRLFSPVVESGRFTAGQIVGIISAAGWALFLPAQAYAIILMPTALAVFVFWFLTWEIVKRSELPRLPMWLLYGLMIGLTAMAVATVLAVLPLLLAALFLKQSNQRPSVAAWKARALAVALLFSGVAVGTAPAWIHNRFIANDAVFLSAHGGINYWIGNNPDANGYPRFTAGMRAEQGAMLEDSTALAEAAIGRPLKRSEVSTYWSKKARAYITSQPVRWLKLLAAKVSNFWNAFEYDDLGVISRLREQGVLFPGIRFGAVAAFALAGLCFAVREFPRSRWVGAAILLQMAAVLPVFITERYRLPAVPGLLMFAAAGLLGLWRAVLQMKMATLGLFVTVLAAATAFVSLPRREPALWALEPYNAGRQALAANNLAAAQQKLEQAAAYVPENTEVNLALGNLWLERHDLSRAQQYYVAALRIDPNHKSALSNLAVLALKQQQPQRAAELLRAALKTAPADAKTHYLLAWAEHALGNLAVANSEIDTAIQLAPEQHEFADFREFMQAEQRKAAGER